MTHQCPACQRTFDEPGFCPFDGKQLVTLDVAQKPTVVSEQFAAAAEPRTIDDAGLDDSPTTANPRKPGPKSSNQIRAQSGARRPDSGVQAISAISALDAKNDHVFREKRAGSEYDSLIGETLDGRYYIQRKIGEGGMGVVFAARHAVIERPLAIKVLKREVMRDAATIKRFVQEARAASRIGHPSIVDVTDFGQTREGMTYSVMEYIDGVTLSKTIRAYAPLPPERSIHIAMQIARALGAAHAKGIVHRDLKPENVFLLSRDGRPDFVKIVDFGIAKVQPIEGSDPNAPRLTRAGTVFGTPEYMAPEQAAGRSDTDGRVDVYALGTILYEMTVGRTPHKSDSMVRTIAMQMLDPILPPSQLHPELSVPKPFELAMMKALAKPREERYQTMGELASALERVLAAIKHPDPTLSLPAVPPGAEPTPRPAAVTAEQSRTGAVTASPPRTGAVTANPPTGAPITVPAVPVVPVRRTKPETRPLHEPQFVTQGPISVVLPATAYEDDEPPPGRRWWIGAVCAVLLGAGGGAVWYATSGGHEVAAGGDGGLLLVTSGDDANAPVSLLDDGGGVIAQVPTDARAILVPPGPGPSPHTIGDAGVLTPHPDRITVEVLTRPAEADVFVGHTFRGPSGVRLTEPYGTTLALECRAPHYKGRVTVVFDGSRDSVMCTAPRLKMCVNGLKNPYDDCEPKGSADPSSGPVTTPHGGVPDREWE